MAEKTVKTNERGYIAVGPDIHKRAKKAAVNLDVSLQDYTIEALERRLEPHGQWHDVLEQILRSKNQMAKNLAIEGLRSAAIELNIEVPKKATG